ncbi:MAG TPA: NYN domain-containing protein, partial [Pirellula sp.]|nr:NYN domain-containing protein [Pirellula sp.]
LPDRYEYQGIQIVFARDWDSADELIQMEIRRHSAPKTLMVVSSDHAIHRKALARGATVIDSDKWLSRQVDSSASRASLGENTPESIEAQDSKSKNRVLTDEEKEKWLKEFGGWE